MDVLRAIVLIVLVAAILAWIGVLDPGDAGQGFTDAITWAEGRLDELVRWYQAR